MKLNTRLLKRIVLNNNETISYLIISSSWVAIAWLLQGHLGINLADEGYLWYGSIAVLSDQLPIRDFQAYDIGRYYWCAFYMWLFKDTGIVMLRIALAMFQIMGLFSFMQILKRVSKKKIFLVIATAFSLICMFPFHKVIDISVSIMTVYALILWFERKNVQARLALGVYLGIVGLIGRNHILYALLALITISSICVLKAGRLNINVAMIKVLIRNSLEIGTGMLIGYSPMIFLLALDFDFLKAFVESIRYLFVIKATNLHLPIPMPWAYPLLGMDYIGKVRGATFAYLLLIMPLVYLSLIFKIKVCDLYKNRVILAASAVGLFYLHYTYSRADVSHLGHSIQPFIILMFAWLFSTRKGIMGKLMPSVFIGMSIFVFIFQQPFLIKQYYPNYLCEHVKIRGDAILCDSDSAEVIRGFQRFNKVISEKKHSLLVLPNLCAIYPILDRESPTKTIFYVFPETVKNQNKSISEIEKFSTEWIVVIDFKLDNREDLRFKNTNPIFHKYIEEYYDKIDTKIFPTNYTVYKRSIMLKQ